LQLQECHNASADVFGCWCDVIKLRGNSYATWDTKHGGTLLCAECGRVNALGYGNNSLSRKDRPAAKPSILFEGAVHRLNDDG